MNGLKDPRLNRANIFMSVAILFSKRATCCRGVDGVLGGACLVQNGRIVSVGYAGSPPGRPHCIDVGCNISPITGGCIATLHAETNCILAAANAGVRPFGVLYTTISPCLSCAKEIITAGISGVIYLKEYRDLSGINYLKDSGVLVQPFCSIEGADEPLMYSILSLLSRVEAK